MLHEVAWANLVSALHVQPSEAWEVTWPEYLSLVIYQHEQDEASNPDKQSQKATSPPGGLSAAEATKAMMAKGSKMVKLVQPA